MLLELERIVGICSSISACIQSKCIAYYGAKELRLALQAAPWQLVFWELQGAVAEACDLRNVGWHAATLLCWLQYFQQAQALRQICLTNTGTIPDE